MKQSVLWSLGIAVGIAASVGAYQLYGSEQETPRAQRSKKETARAEERSSDQSAHLQTELNSMKAQLSAIKTHLSARSAAAEETANAEEEETPLSPQEQRANEARAWKEHMAKVARAFDAEVVDPQWASVTSETVEAAIKADPVIAASAGDVQCRSQTCRVEIKRDASGSVDKQIPLFVHNLGSTLPFGQADRIENSDGTTTLAMYLGTRAPTASEPPAR